MRCDLTRRLEAARARRRFIGLLVASALFTSGAVILLVLWYTATHPTPPAVLP